MKKKYAVVGVGGRSIMFTDSLAKKYHNCSKLVSICDINDGRLKLAMSELRPAFPGLESYKAEEFDKMLIEQHPDYVIVTTRDCDHDDYICRSLELGCDVITEKPMTIDERRCQRIIDTIKKTGHNVRVTFNYRYSPPRSQIKQLLLDGVIGKILSVQLSWYLDTNHGADYFRRWHSNKCNSGGLLVHKATHHFDLINWWLDSVPQTVFASGQRVYYNSAQAKRMGLTSYGPRCLDCSCKNRCNFYLDMASIPTIKELYLDNEQFDGYIRDKCVFRDDIDIEDSVGALIQYKNGVVLTYSLNAFMPWEGYRLEINGTKGKLEQLCQETSYVNGDGTVQGALRPEGTTLKIYPHFKAPYQVPIWQGIGAHGGGDIVLLEDIFGNPSVDKLNRAADYVQGAYSILTGIAANNSIATGEIVYVNSLVKGLPVPNVLPKNENENISYVSNTKLMAGNTEVQANIPKRPVLNVINE